MFRFTSKPIEISTVDESNTNEEPPSVMTPNAAATPSAKEQRASNGDDEGIIVDLPTLHEEAAVTENENNNGPPIRLESETPKYDNSLDRDHKGPIMKRVDDSSFRTIASDASIELDVLLRHAQMRSLQEQGKSCKSAESPKSGCDSIDMAELLHLTQLRLKQQQDRESSKDETNADNNKTEEDHCNVLDQDEEEDMTNTSLCLHFSEDDISRLDEMDLSVAPAPATPAERSSSIVVTPEKEELDRVEDRSGAVNERVSQSSFLMRNKVWVMLLLLLVIGAIAQKPTQWFTTNETITHDEIPINSVNSTDFTHNEPPVNSVKIDIGSGHSSKDIVSEPPLNSTLGVHDTPKATLGRDMYNTEEINSTGWSIWSCFQVFSVGLLAKLLMGRSDAPAAKNEGATNSSNKLRALSAFIKRQEEDDQYVCDFNLSRYEDLKVSELRELLRIRKCNYTGKKDKLVHRLASVYRSELQSMTVQQLRRKMKGKGFKQGGLKKDLVKQLVETGLK